MHLKLAKNHKPQCSTPAINEPCANQEGCQWDILEIILGPQLFMQKITGYFILLKASFQIESITLNCREI